jgi:hypothetical protein
VFLNTKQHLDLPFSRTLHALTLVVLSLPLHRMRELLASLAEIDRVVKSKPFLENDFS